MARYIIKFCKGEEVKFISHLDLMRCMQRALRRAKVDVSYTKGFNPHAQLSFATPLPVGISSRCEYMSIKTDGKIDAEKLVSRLNRALPQGLEIISAAEVDDNYPSLMSKVKAALYEIALTGVDREKFTDDIFDLLMKEPSVEVTKKSKNGEKLIDIKGMILNIKLERVDNDGIVFEALLSSGINNNLNPILLTDALRSHIESLGDSKIKYILKLETLMGGDH